MHTPAEYLIFLGVAFLVTMLCCEGDDNHKLR